MTMLSRGFKYRLLQACCRLILIELIPAQMVLDDTTIRSAVNAWLSNATAATALYGPISSWNTTLVTDLSWMFSGAQSFNGDVSLWNTGRVTDMRGVFYGAQSFNADVSLWNTASVTDMTVMFYAAYSFNGNVSSWNTDRVTDMNGMVYGATSFNGDVSSWNTARVTNMSNMFKYARSFNQTLCWNTLKSDTSSMFDQSYGSLKPYPSCLPPPTSEPTNKPTYRGSSKPTQNPSARRSFHPTISPTTDMIAWPKPWTTHVSPLYGTVTKTLSLGYGSCPKGSKVVVIKAGTSDRWILQLSIQCDDDKHTVFGPWGLLSNDKLSFIDFSCPQGYSGWNITYGDYLGRLELSCALSLQSMGMGRSSGSIRNANWTLNTNQSIIGLQTYYDLLGIHAIRIEYADFPPKKKCFDYNNQWTGECPSTGDWLAILWGFLTVIGLAFIAVSIMGYNYRRRHKIEFQKFDTILPPK